MSVQNKPDYKIFASGAKPGEVISFPDILRGWGVTLDTTGGIPPLEFFNSASMRLNEWLMYLTQRGVPEWDAAVDYPKSAMVMLGDVFYVSLKATKNENPSTSQLSWKKFSDFFGIDGKLSKDQNGADIPNKPKFIENLGLGGAAKSNVTQTTGASTTNVMSQKAVTDELKNKASNTALTDGLNKKFDKTGGTITTLSKAIDIVTKANAAGYIQISDENEGVIHRIGKIGANSTLTIFNGPENAKVTINEDGVRFNGSQLALKSEIPSLVTKFEDVTTSRSNNVNYVNTNSHPIFIVLQSNANINQSATYTVNGVVVRWAFSGPNVGFSTSATIPVPPGATYSANGFEKWFEVY